MPGPVTKGERREQGRRKAHYGPKDDGRSVFVLQQIIGKRAQAVIKKQARDNLPK